MLSASFDPVASFYDPLARLIFGEAISKAQFIFLDQIPRRSRILIIGGGSGWILKKVLEETRPASVLYLEASGKMLQKAKQAVKHIANNSLVQFQLGTERDITNQAQFEVIITNFFLDLFSEKELKNTTYILNEALKYNGLWLATDFINPPGTWFKKFIATLLFKCMYLFFRATCKIPAKELPDWENLLDSYSLLQLKSAYFYGSLIKATVWQKRA